MIHDDLSPRNVTQSTTGDVAIIDFDLADGHDCDYPSTCEEVKTLADVLVMDVPSWGSWLATFFRHRSVGISLLFGIGILSLLLVSCVQQTKSIVKGWVTFSLSSPLLSAMMNKCYRLHEPVEARLSLSVVCVGVESRVSQTPVVKSRVIIRGGYSCDKVCIASQ